MATITPTGIRLTISSKTMNIAALALLDRAKMFAREDFTKEFALSNLEEIRTALTELGWVSPTIDECIAKVNEDWK